MRMKVFVTGSNSGHPYREGSTSSFASLVQDLGHQLSTDLSGDPDVLVCVDYHPKFKNEILRARSLGVPTVLVKQEPSVTAPVHMLKNPGNLFDLVVKRGDPHGSPIFNTFQEWDTRFLGQVNRKERVVAINADKWSAIRGELYSFRRACYNSDDRIDLFGHGWNDKNLKRFERLIKEVLIAVRFGQFPILRNSKNIFLKPLNYLGQSQDKMETLGAYKVSLVIENSQEYMSEKLIDALLAGNVPVYVGADPERFGIPKELFFHCEPDVGLVKEKISEALVINSEDFQSKVSKWIASEGVKGFWEVRSVTKTLLDYIECKLVNQSMP